jgi:hypothetical protein
MDRKLRCPWNRCYCGGDIVMFLGSSRCHHRVSGRLYIPVFATRTECAGTDCVWCRSAPLAGPLRLHVYCVFEEVV